MKVGDLVKFCENFLPELKGKVGILIEIFSHTIATKLPSTAWLIMIDGKIHPYFIQEHFLTRI